MELINLFPSTAFMVGTDILLIVLFFIVVSALLLSRKYLTSHFVLRGILLICLGFGVIVSIFVYDLYTMMLLPAKIGMRAAMEEMAILHIQHSWYMHIAGMTLICVGFVIVVLQSTKQVKELDKKVQQEMDANLAKSSFLSSMSHELRTPLNAIKGYSEMMFILPEGREEGWYRENAQIVSQSATYLNNLVEGILDLSRIESGKVEYSFEAIDMELIFEEINEMFLPTIAEKQIEYNVDVNARSDGLWADKQAIKQVLLNLISNAIKHTPRNGEIKVSAVNLNNGNVEILVQDTGGGIPEEIQQGLFSPFPSRNPYSTKNNESFGLGLAISKGIVDAHNGQIEVADTSPEGTVMRIELPKQKRVA